MTSTSFQSCQAGGHDTLHNSHLVERSSSVNGEGASQDVLGVALSYDYAAEQQRMKALAGQRRFQAPVADDFARGMLAPDDGGATVTASLKRSNGVWAALTGGLTARWRGQKSV
ncbi:MULTISPECIES: type III secretion protein [Pseudomonas]|uniref:type III secretion protein n=1 Tax=Pseudomonas TaxID=286 RepID=UPI002113E2D2|nr:MULTISPECIES: type III secretion protein [unclassified Pseudomonas]MCV2227389.1 type III secretion protein [Pseudomonas sp. AU10]